MNRITHIKNRLVVWGAAAVWAALSALAAAGDGIPAHLENFTLDSRQPSPHASESPDGEIIYLVESPGAPWLRVKLADYCLSPDSHISFTALKDGSTQRQTAQTLPQWDNMSAFFNGEAVAVQLHRGPGGKDDYLIIEDIVVGEILGGIKGVATDGGPSLTTICGPTDDRVPSVEARPARLTFVFANGTPNNACTAFPVSNGSLLSAGHCVDFDPDGFGAGLPDGVLDIDANDVVEFNPPNSLANGTLQFAPADDQYSMDLTSFTFDYDGEGNSVGLDWSVFRCNRNPNTNLTPAMAQGFYRMTNGNPAVNDTIRISGYGTDGSPNLTRNQIQQTHTGPYVSETVNGARINHDYQVDTTGGNSGSPIIWVSNGYTVGIHTNAGCGNNGGSVIGSNSGTSFEHNPLEAALEAFPGANAVFVDQIRFDAVDDGTIFHPHDTVAKGVNTVPNNGRLILVEGAYAENMLISKPMLIRAPVGSAIIGD